MPVARFARRKLQDALRDYPEMLEVWQAAEVTNTHERTVRRWLANGTLAGLQRGAGCLLVPKEALIDFLTGVEPTVEKE